MAQKNNTVNFVIHDAKGQPQMIKVVQQDTSPSSMSATPSECSISPPGTVYKTVNITTANGTSKLVQVPIQTLAQLQKTVLETEKRKKKDIFIEVPNATNILPSSAIKMEPQSPDDDMPSSAHNGVSYMTNYRKRGSDPDSEAAEYSTKRRRAADKVGKGLRHFSKKVCEKVRNKGFTSYNEVADELVAEFTANLHGNVTQQFDQKNIRRRVYDALNVLMAMNIISKEKKEIQWLGLPTNSAQECSLLEKDKQSKLQRIQQKTQQLHELIMQQISFKSLVERNRSAESRGLRPSPSSAIHLPFIVVNTSEKALIDCSISNDKTEYMFKFNKRFQIHDDIDILKRMGLLFGLDKGECTEADLYRAKCMVPKSLGYYLEHFATGKSAKLAEILEASGDEESDHSSTDTDLSAEEDDA